MPWKFSSNLILRVPALSADQYAGKLEMFLQNKFFLSAIWLASPVFFNQLEKAGFNLAQLSPKEQRTLQKYANRICFRPVPFGLFASVSLVRWGKNLAVQKKASSIPEIFPSQEWLVKYEQRYPRNETDERFVVNPTLYRLLNEFRFIRTDLAENTRGYLLQSIAYTSLLNELLLKAGFENRPAKLIQKIMQLSGCSPSEADAYLNFLTEAQLFLPAGHAAIRPGRISTLTHLIQSIPKLPLLNGSDLLLANGDVDLGQLRSVGDSLRNLVNEPIGGLLPFNVILRRQADGETLPASWQEELSAALGTVEALVPNATNPVMDAFVKAFRQRFGDEHVPLLKALDPEIGISYGPPVQELDNSFLETVHIQDVVPDGVGGQWTAAHAFLMQCWHSSIGDGSSVITLCPEGMSDLPSGNSETAVLGMSVLFRYTGTELWIENAGGVNPLALAGRFSIADEAILTAAREMARETEAMYPELLFAELLHISDPHVDNVNVRETFWRYDLPVTATSRLPVSQQLPLADLVLRLKGDRIILWSLTHQKMVVPRLSSAYNHSLNKLPLFRFLADIPYQFARSSYKFDLRDFFPGLSHYPRVQYLKTILQPACWLLKRSQIAALTESAASITDVNYQLNSLGIPDVFSMGENDQQVLIFRAREDDVRLFLSMLGKQTEVLIREMPGAPELTSRQGHPVQYPVRQYNAFVLPSDPHLFPTIGPLPSAISLPQKFVPGSEWLYLKIYMPGSQANHILLQSMPILNRRYQHGQISKWFFIRYHDNGPHIRLRIQLHPEMINDVLQQFKALLQNKVRQHMIREFQIDTYSREMARYGTGGYTKTETFFWRSSELVARFIKYQQSADTLTAYHFALITTELIARKFIPDRADLISFYANSYSLFLPEFEGIDVAGDLAKKYREIRPVIEGRMSGEHLNQYPGFKVALRHFEDAAAQFHLPDSAVARQFLGSLIHMHLNRIYTDHSRKQEMMTYYMLFKHSRSVLARSK